MSESTTTETVGLRTSALEGAARDTGLHRLAWPLAHGLVFAAALALMRILIHWAASPFRADMAYKLGVVLGLGWAVLSGTILGLPQARRMGDLRGRLVSSLLTAVGFVMTSMSSHYHAVFNRLPGVESLAPLYDPETLRFSTSSHWPWWLVVLEVIVPVVVVFVLTPRVAGRMRRWLEEPVLRRRTLWALALLPVLSLASVLAGQGQLRYGALPPLAHMLLSSRPLDPARDNPLQVVGRVPSAPDPAVVFRVQEALGVQDPGPVVSPVYPLCRPPGIHSTVAHPRSVILLILESVGEREMAMEYQRRTLMGRLQAIATRSVHFTNFHAQGDRSAQALVGILSGIPAPTHRRLLLHKPMVNLMGLPADLERAGYETVYMHGSDLSFEQQRQYLQMVGFGDIHEPDLTGVGQTQGWGVPDGEMLELLQEWIDSREGRGLYFATLFTISTHDPYAIPVDEAGDLPGNREFDRFARSLEYLDRSLGRFWQWYVEEEMDRGTILVITGDHAPRLPHPGDPMRTNTGELEYRFEVPLIIAGLTDEERLQASRVVERAGGHLDIPQTILGMLGIQSCGCYQGRDLLDQDDPWPERRMVVSTAGEQLEFFYIHQGKKRWMLNTRNEELKLHDPSIDPLLRTDLLAASQKSAPTIREFVRAYFRLGRYLNYGDRYSPLTY